MNWDIDLVEARCQHPIRPSILATIIRRIHSATLVCPASKSVCIQAEATLAFVGVHVTRGCVGGKWVRDKVWKPAPHEIDRSIKCNRFRQTMSVVVASATATKLHIGLIGTDFMWASRGEDRLYVCMCAGVPVYKGLKVVASPILTGGQGCDNAICGHADKTHRADAMATCSQSSRTRESGG
ncbi:unnamed protein product [Protopolystoma xenopodis]|uniref:Uncharacterized protein n=1 Tax=Protopolystoma xenopodis TaxID=117903 RepID=A0A448WB42_9PLAT|nr:unnamed protein product [Protopolystoma xenopodis]